MSGSYECDRPATEPAREPAAASPDADDEIRAAALADLAASDWTRPEGYRFNREDANQRGQ
jgi:hypothetical protein